MTKVKICGITNLKDARMCAALGTDFLGFIFYKKSRRYVSVERAKRIIKALKSPVYKVGVFVNEEPEKVKEIAVSCGLDFLQFHGDETPEYLFNFKKFRVIKAFRVADRICSGEVSSYLRCYILFDTFKKNCYGGTGEVFDWGVLKAAGKIRRRFIISGGLTPENVGGLVRSIKPYAVDVAGGVEKSPGIKDERLVKNFIEAVRSFK